jgi:superfamily I DNA and RNA helicase
VVDDGNRDILAAIMAAHALGAGVAANVIKTRALKMNE